MYKDEAGKMLCNYSAVPDTPEIERIKNTQKNISLVSSSSSAFRCDFSYIFKYEMVSLVSWHGVWIFE